MPVSAGTSRRYRVVHVSTVHPPGDNRILYRECRSLADAGFDVHYVGQSASTVEDLPGVGLHDIPSPRSRIHRMIASPMAAATIVRRLHPDVVHLHDPELIPLAGLLKASGCAVVYDAHEHLPSQVRGKEYLPDITRGIAAGLAKALERAADAVSDAVVCATPRIAEAHATVPTYVVRNYPHRSDARTPRAENAGRDRVVAYVGAIREERGIRQLVEAVELAAREETVGLVLAGRFAPPELLGDVSQMPGWRHVDYLGQVGAADVPFLLSGAVAGMVTFLPSPNNRDGQPTKLYEYMAAGLPVVASDFPGWRSVVATLGCGLLVDPSSPRQIADSILELLRDPKEARRAGLRGRSAVVEQLNWETQAEVLLEAYAQVLRARQPRHRSRHE